MKELGGSNRISGPTDAGASSQVSIINAAVQSKPDALIIAGNDPNAIAPALKQAAQKGVKVVSMDSDVAPDARSVFINQVTTQLVGQNQVESIAQARSTTRARSRSSRRPPTPPTRTPGSR